MFFIIEFSTTKLNEVTVSKKNLFRGHENMTDLEGNVSVFPPFSYGFVSSVTELENCAAAVLRYLIVSLINALP